VRKANVALRSDELRCDALGVRRGKNSSKTWFGCLPAGNSFPDMVALAGPCGVGATFRFFAGGSGCGTLAQSTILHFKIN
jgi:hypothetical protein